MSSRNRSPQAEGEKDRAQVIIEISPPPDSAPDYESHLDLLKNVPSFVLDEQFGRLEAPPESVAAVSKGTIQRSGTYLIRGSVDRGMLEDLKKTRHVVHVYPDEPIVPFGSPTESCDCNYARPTGSINDLIGFLGLDQIWQDGVTGRKVVIGFVDGGITASNRPLQSGEMPAKTLDRVVDGWPTHDWGTKAGWAEHGNIAALTALAVAPEASAYDIRISDHGLISDALRAYEWIIERFCRDGTPQVLCNAWGIATESAAPSYAVHPHHILTRKVVEAARLGILVVFAAGNYGCGCALNTPGFEPDTGFQILGANGDSDVMTVAGVNLHGVYVGYSSAGPATLDQQKPNFCAPTHFVNEPYIATGTSAACAVTAGVLSLLKQAQPSLIQRVATTTLERTANDSWGAGWNRFTGSGIIQPQKACSLLSVEKSLKQGAR